VYRAVRLASGALLRIGDFVRMTDDALGRVGGISWNKDILHQPILDCEGFQNLMPTLDLDRNKAFEGRQVQIQMEINIPILSMCRPGG
jgi:hypothetical protein